MKASDYMPALKQGAKIFPEDIAGMLGLPSVGNIFYVDPGAGSDTANSGTTRDDAFATLTQAYAALTADQDDVVIISGSSSTGRTTEAAAMTWAKRRTHVIGNGPARRMNQRNGISFGSAVVSPCLTISATDCSFTNISIAVFNDINVLVNVTGSYNTFRFVHFQGIGNDTTGDDTAGRSLVITGAGENEFYECTIGLDTVTRSAANANLELTGSCPRNKFIRCDFPMYADNAGAFWLKADTGNCFERFLLLEECNFWNPTDGSSTGLTAGFKLTATGNGEIRMINSSWNGATDLSTDYTCLYSNTPVYDTQDSGKAIKVTT